MLALLLVQFVGIPFSLIFGRLPSKGESRRPFYLAFVLYNLIALPLAGVLGGRWLSTDNISAILGLIIAVLLAPILGNLPSPFGEILPFLGALLFAYLGVAVMLMRRRDLFSLIGNRLGGEAASPEERPYLLDTSVIIDGRVAGVEYSEPAADLYPAKKKIFRPGM